MMSVYGCCVTVYDGCVARLCVAVHSAFVWLSYLSVYNLMYILLIAHNEEVFPWKIYLRNLNVSFTICVTSFPDYVTQKVNETLRILTYIYPGETLKLYLINTQDVDLQTH